VRLQLAVELEQERMQERMQERVQELRPGQAQRPQAD
jgi:hypothetical protein